MFDHEVAEVHICCVRLIREVRDAGAAGHDALTISVKAHPLAFKLP